MPREDEELQSAFEEQAGSASGSRELCDLFGLDAGGSHAALRDRIFSLVTGPPSRRRWGWLDLLLQVHAAGAQSVDDLEPEDLESSPPGGSSAIITIFASLSDSVLSHINLGT